MVKGRLRLHDRVMCEAVVVSTGGTCVRRRVGCVLVDVNGKTLSTGYNGPPSGFPHCVDSPCSGASMASGSGLATCQAVHAEQNALLQCEDVSQVDACYTTTSPCPHCVKLLLNTGCRQIVFLEEYPDWESCRDLWLTPTFERWGSPKMPKTWVKYGNGSDPQADHVMNSLRANIAHVLG